uniref:Uncharacterized protein n=1 Tax=Lepeophtheirus salmonis TaxID=72036 RepID=A0A0K2TBT0_LEPSM
MPFLATRFAPPSLIVTISVIPQACLDVIPGIVLLDCIFSCMGSCGWAL